MFFQVFVLAVGMDVRMKELSKLVSSKEDLFHALTYSELKNPTFSGGISKSLCAAAGNTIVQYTY